MKDPRCTQESEAVKPIVNAQMTLADRQHSALLQRRNEQIQRLTEQTEEVNRLFHHLESLMNRRNERIRQYMREDAARMANERIQPPTPASTPIDQPLYVNTDFGDKSGNVTDPNNN
ncbi:unnamed protein product [Caenorhabditis brenneri]